MINTGLDSAVNTLQSAITAINNNIGNGYVYAGVATPSTSPVTGKVFYLAVQAGTYTNFGNAVVTAGLNVIKYNGSAWSVDQVMAIDAEPTQGSANLVKSGGVLNSIIQNGPAFDLSAYNAQGGVLATYADLSAALTALNALPADFKQPGMSIKYVQTSDNKYVQARCTANEFTTDITKWQNVDDKISELEDKVIKTDSYSVIGTSSVTFWGGNATGKAGDVLKISVGLGDVLSGFRYRINGVTYVNVVGKETIDVVLDTDMTTFQIGAASTQIIKDGSVNYSIVLLHKADAKDLAEYKEATDEKLKVQSVGNFYNGRLTVDFTEGTASISNGLYFITNANERIELPAQNISFEFINAIWYFYADESKMFRCSTSPNDVKYLLAIIYYQGSLPSLAYNCCVYTTVNGKLWEFGTIVDIVYKNQNNITKLQQDVDAINESISKKYKSTGYELITSNSFSGIAYNRFMECFHRSVCGISAIFNRNDKDVIVYLLNGLTKHKSVIYTISKDDIVLNEEAAYLFDKEYKLGVDDYIAISGNLLYGNYSNPTAEQRLLVSGAEYERNDGTWSTNNEGMMFAYNVLYNDLPENQINKTFSILTDSIGTLNYCSREKRHYANILEDVCGMRLLQRMSKGGAPIMQGLVNDENYLSRPDRYNNLFSNGASGEAPDIIIFAAGINDLLKNETDDASTFIHAMQLGTWNSNVSACLNNTTFYEAYEYMLYNLTNKYPTSTIICCTPMRTYTEKGMKSFYPCTNDYNITIESVANAIKDCCSKFGVRCLDLYNNHILNRPNRNLLTVDLLHPNDLGYAYIASMMMNEIKSIM